MANKLPIKPVGMMVNGALVPFPSTTAIAAAQRQVLQAHVGLDELMDHHALVREVWNARRAVILDEAEERVEAEHQRELAALRRRQEVAEMERLALAAETKRDVEIEFKPVRFANGQVNAAKRRAQSAAELAEAKLKEALALDEDEDVIITPPPKARTAPTMAQMLAEQVDILQREIDSANADGKDVRPLIQKRDVLNELLRQALMRDGK